MRPCRASEVPVTFNYRLIYDEHDERVMYFIITDMRDNDLAAVILKEMTPIDAPRLKLRPLTVQQYPPITIEGIKYRNDKKNPGIKHIPRLLRELMEMLENEVVLCKTENINIDQYLNYVRFEKFTALTSDEIKIYAVLAGFLDSTVDDFIPTNMLWNKRTGFNRMVARTQPTIVNERVEQVLQKAESKRSDK